MIRVLVAAADLAAEPSLVAALQPEPDLTIAGRCVDANLLVAQAQSCDAQAVFLSDGLPNLQPRVIEEARRAGLRVVGIREASGATSTALEMPWIDISGGFEPLLQHLREDRQQPGVWQLPSETLSNGQLISVWGPAGAPGRTTIATALAAEIATAQRTMLVDADPFGGSIAVRLGVNDDVSGIAIACTQAMRGNLDREAMLRIPRAIAPRLSLVSGIHAARRWPELTEINQVWPVCTELVDVVIADLGFCLEDADDVGRRTRSTVQTLTNSDVVVAVCAAEPAGMLRFFDALPALREVASQAEVKVVVNKLRKGVLGESSIAQAFAAAGIAEITMVPQDDPGCAHDIARGSLPAAKSPIREALRPLAQALAGV